MPVALHLPMMRFGAGRAAVQAGGFAVERFQAVLIEAVAGRRWPRGRFGHQLAGLQGLGEVDFLEVLGLVDQIAHGAGRILDGRIGEGGATPPRRACREAGAQRSIALSHRTKLIGSTTQIAPVLNRLRDVGVRRRI